MSLFDAVTKISIEPSPPEPQELMAFKAWKNSPDAERISQEEKRKRTEEFYKQIFIQEYLDKKWKAELTNRDNYLWLRDYEKNYVKSPAELPVVQNKIKQLTDHIRAQKNVFPALKMVI